MTQFLRLFLHLGVLCFCMECFFCRGASLPDLTRFAFESPQMGVPFRIVFYSQLGPNHASQVADAVWKRMAELNAILSNYETNSELSQLGYASGQGEWTVVSDEMWSILTFSQQLSLKSDGAFDITLGPATALWRKVRRESKMPDPSALAHMWKRTGWRHLILRPEDQSVCLAVPGMRLDPGGIAKGYALDEGLKVLQQFGIRHAFVSGGGDMAFAGGKPDGQGWQIRLAGFDPDQVDGQVIELNDGAVATSGDLFQYVDIEGIRYSHILDPKTGLGVTLRTLTTVVASRGILADSLATTLSVLGPDQAPEWLLEHAADAGARILWLDDDQKSHEWTRGTSRYSF